MGHAITSRIRAAGFPHGPSGTLRISNMPGANHVRARHRLQLADVSRLIDKSNRPRYTRNRSPKMCRSLFHRSRRPSWLRLAINAAAVLALAAGAPLISGESREWLLLGEFESGWRNAWMERKLADQANRISVVEETPGDRALKVVSSDSASAPSLG